MNLPPDTKNSATPASGTASASKTATPSQKPEMKDGAACSTNKDGSACSTDKSTGAKKTAA